MGEPRHAQMFLAVFSAEVSLDAAHGWLAYQVQVLQVTHYVQWAHHHWEVLLATQGPPSHPLWFKETEETAYFSAAEDECSHAAHGTRGGCPLPLLQVWFLTPPCSWPRWT